MLYKRVFCYKKGYCTSTKHKLRIKYNNYFNLGTLPT